jgi:predicted type IV restriction endonuclease
MGQISEEQNMSTLNDAVKLVRSRIEKHASSKSMNEQNTKASLIEPILRALGWDVEDVDEVVHEYRRNQSDNPVDYAMLIMRTPKLFLEAKALSKNLDDARWAHQVLGYAGVSGVGWAVLTNGDEYRIYNTHATVPVESKLFHSVRISDPKSPVAEVLSLLSKDQLQENTIDVLWKAYYVDQQVGEILADLFSNEPADEFIGMIKAKSGKLRAEDIAASLHRARVSIDYPVDFKPPKKNAQPTSRVMAPTKTASGDLADIINAGLIEMPLQVEREYKGERVTARIESAGEIVYGQISFRSLSQAGTAARKAILRLPTEAKGPATNGWTFWKFRDNEGALKPMDVLRRKYKKRDS